MCRERVHVQRQIVIPNELFWFDFSSSLGVGSNHDDDDKLPDMAMLFWEGIEANNYEEIIRSRAERLVESAPSSKT